MSSDSQRREPVLVKTLENSVKLLVLSDLHVEFRPYTPDAEAVRACDVVVLAGDIHRGASAVRWAAEAFAGKPIVMVAGNHEFYRGHWEQTLESMRQESLSLGVHFLEDDEVTISGVRFLGCTLWVDFLYFGESGQADAMRLYQSGLNDCRLITEAHSTRARSETLKPQSVLARHQASRSWLDSALEVDYSGRTVVVTHHLPLAECVVTRYRTDALTPGFASRLPEDLVARADLWIHGHTHDTVVLEPVGVRPRIVCNPRGYPVDGRNENQKFSDAFIVEL